MLRGLGELASSATAGRALGRRLLSNLTPRELTKVISRAPSVSRLLSVHEAHADDFSDIHLSACWSRMAKLSERQTDEVLLVRLRTQSVDMLRDGCLSSRAMSNVAHAIAVCQPPSLSEGAEDRCRWSELWDAIAQSASTRVMDMNEQEMCSLAWSYATAEQAARPAGAALMNEIGRVGAKRARTMTSHGLANLAWAFATARLPAPVPAMYKAIAVSAQPRLRLPLLCLLPPPPPPSLPPPPIHYRPPLPPLPPLPLPPES